MIKSKPEKIIGEHYSPKNYDLNLVGPSPELAEKIQEQLIRLRSSTDLTLASLVTMKESAPAGMNDGLIYPGNLFPIGTTAEVARSAATQLAPPRGTIRIIVVLAQFPDKAMTQTKKHFEDLLFSIGILPKGSMREYWREVSNGLIDVIGEVAGPFTLPKKLVEYANNNYGIGGTAPNARNMAADAAAAANPTVNFAQYDNNGDGYVDVFMVIHAGAEAAQTGNKNDIWAHKWVLPSEYNADGVKIYGYDTVAESAQIGVCAHELGHLLFGFPDLYDTDYSSSGIGNWCLMSGGSWNGGGQTPAHPSAFLKQNQGWATVITPTTNGSAALQAVETGHTIYKLWKNGAPANEYYLIENRQKILFDSALPGDGILVWHVDEAIATNNDENHPKVALEQADGKKDLEAARNRGDAGDPYPGTMGNKLFNFSSNPTSKSYGSLDTYVSVKNIPNSAATMNFDYTVKLIIKKVEKEKEILWDKKALAKDYIIDKNPKEFEYKPIFDNRPPKSPKETIEGFKPPGGYEREAQPCEPTLEQRVAMLEMRLAQVEPFINSALRPDMRKSALGQEQP